MCLFGVVLQEVWKWRCGLECEFNGWMKSWHNAAFSLENKPVFHATIGLRNTNRYVSIRCEFMRVSEVEWIPDLPILLKSTDFVENFFFRRIFMVRQKKKITTFALSTLSDATTRSAVNGKEYFFSISGAKRAPENSRALCDPG